MELICRVHNQNKLDDNADVDHSAIVAGNDNDIVIEVTIEQINEIIPEIEKSLENEEISEEDRETAFEVLTEIKEKISQNKKMSIVKATLGVLKDFLISVGASVTAGIIQSKIFGIF